VVGGERERRQRRSRVRGVAFLTRAAPRQKVEEGGGEKKINPQFSATCPSRPLHSDRKIPKPSIFFCRNTAGFFLTTARSGERSQAGDAIATVAVAVACPPRTSGDRPPSLMGSRGRARPRGRFVLDLGGYTAKDSRFPA
jgi:hypothetical protein